MKPEITCVLCGEDFSECSDEARILHLITTHSREVLDHPRVQTGLMHLQELAFSFGQNLAARLRGK